MFFLLRFVLLVIICQFFLIRFFFVRSFLLLYYIYSLFCFFLFRSFGLTSKIGVAVEKRLSNMKNWRHYLIKTVWKSRIGVALSRELTQQEFSKYLKDKWLIPNQKKLGAVWVKIQKFWTEKSFSTEHSYTSRNMANIFAHNRQYFKL